MGRSRSKKITEVKQQLLARISSGMYLPGDRFLSNREISQRFIISYQSAHRLVTELCEEGHLVRRPQSGTYLPGKMTQLEGVQLVFNRRAKLINSFGAKLLELLTRRLDVAHINYEITFITPKQRNKVHIPTSRFPVLWEASVVVDQCVKQQRSLVIIDDRPPMGAAAAYVDSVSVDDFSGGVCAAQLLLLFLKENGCVDNHFSILAGPADDLRSQARVSGFCSVTPAQVVIAGSWYREDGYSVVDQVLKTNPSGIFCCNDSLAEAVIAYAKDHHLRLPAIVGFDDAPAAETHNLTTIALPWTEIVQNLFNVIHRRLEGDRSVSSQIVLNPRPVIRSFGLKNLDGLKIPEYSTLFGSEYAG